IERDKSGLPRLGLWQKYPANAFQGQLLKLINDALSRGSSKKGRTMPAANMVLGPYDVPRDYFPDYRGNACGPVEWVTEDDVVSSYKASFRPEQPDHVILSLCYVFSHDYGLDDHIRGALEARRHRCNTENGGPTV